MLIKLNTNSGILLINDNDISEITAKAFPGINTARNLIHGSYIILRSGGTHNTKETPEEIYRKF